MASLWARDMVEPFHYRTVVGTDTRGDSTYSEAVPARCRYEATIRMIRLPNGDMVATKGILRTEAQVPATARVWIPGADPDDVGQSMLPLQVDPLKLLGEASVDHYVVYL